jgi:peptidyl-prolyl cis-trans isomerase C
MMMAAPTHAQNGGPIKVNGTTIPQQRVDFFLKNLIAQGRPDTPEMRDAVRQELINRELMTQEAVRRGLDKTSDVSMQMELARQDILARAYLQDIAGKSPVTEDALKKEYERIKGQLGTREYKARHILVDKEDEAKEIIAQIKKGGSFDKLAAEKSKDPGSKVRGGELDWAVPGNYVKPFGDALARLKKGQMTEAPVQTNFGWHIIRLDDERALKVPGYDEVKPNLQQNLQRQVQERALTDLRAKAKIE